MSEPDPQEPTELETNQENSKSKKIRSIVDWSYIIFVTICFISFLTALVLTLEVPLKFALIAGLTPVGVIFLVFIILSCFFKWELRIWRETFLKVAGSETTTIVIKSILLPALLVILYFYISGEDGQNTLYTSSPVTSEMIVHPCGSSYRQRQSGLVVWDAADLISQPSESEVFVVTNAVFGINQTRGVCPQTGAYCSTINLNPGRQSPNWLSKVPWIFAHDYSRAAIWNPVGCSSSDIEGNNECIKGILYDNGIQTGDCYEEKICTINGWCPPITLANFLSDAMFQTADFTIFLDMRPNFPEFKGPSWTKGGDPGGYTANYAEIYAKYHKYSRSVETCLYNLKKDPYCPRFRLRDIVEESKSEGLLGYTGNWTEAESFGGQFKIDVDWSCKFDWGNDIFDCLSKFKFISRANNKGKPKIFPKITFQDDDRRTVTYSLGISVSISHVGRGMQIQLYNLFFYAQFIYISYAMLKGPVLWIVRCLITIFFMFKNNGKSK